MVNKERRVGAIGAVALGVLLAGLVPWVILRLEWSSILLIAAAVSAMAGPPCLLLAVAFVTPGPAPVRTALWTGAVGIAAAVLFAILGRGAWGFMFMSFAAGVVILVPVYLGAFGWLAVGWLRKDAVALARIRSGAQVAVVLGMITWALPLGAAVNRWDVRRAKAFTERLAAAIQEEKVRTGEYPPHEGIRDFARGVGWMPSLMADGFHYYAGESGFELGFQDRTEMFAGYEFRGPDGGWSHWVD